MPDVKVTYDKTANAAYIYFTDPQVSVRSAHTYPCYSIDVDGMINLHFDEQGRLSASRSWPLRRSSPSTCSKPPSGSIPR